LSASPLPAGAGHLAVGAVPGPVAVSQTGWSTAADISAATGAEPASKKAVSSVFRGVGRASQVSS
jgi:hypothetical protein